MLDLKWIRDHSEIFEKEMNRRGLSALNQQLLTLDHAHRTALTQLQELQSERNQCAKSIGQAKAKGDDATDLMVQSQRIKDVLPELEVREQALNDQLQDLLIRLPNILDPDVPAGADETDNQVLKHWGTPTTLSFAPQPHYELGEALGLMDFTSSAKIAGSRFVILKGALAMLERALGQFMIDLHTREFGYTLISPPLLVRDEVMFGTGQLPKFGEDSFKTTDGRWLIPTAEVPITNLVREQILDYKELPLRYVCFSPCFRSEAGSAGRDTRGMIRQHQFYKVELVSIVHPDTASAEHQRLVQAAETVLQRLELPYRLVLLCAGDTGSTMHKTYDLEVWLPAENTYREISSCSNAGSFQARRMNARFRENPDGHFKTPLSFVHTLNGSGVAVGRALVAVLENYQQQDGSIIIPQVLRPYMNGLEIIKPVCHA